MRVILIILLMFFGSSIVAKNVKSEQGIKYTEYTCVGTYIFVFNDVYENFLVDLVIEEYSYGNATTGIKLHAEYIANNDENIRMFENTSSHLIASSSDDSSGEKLLIRFDKVSGKVLLVSNFDDGRSTKFEGNCY